MGLFAWSCCFPALGSPPLSSLQQPSYLPCPCPSKSSCPSNSHRETPSLLLHPSPVRCVKAVWVQGGLEPSTCQVPPRLKLVKSLEGFPWYEASGPRTRSCGKPGLANSSICGTVCSFCLFFLFHWCQWSRYCKSAMLKTPYGMKFQIPGVHQLMFCVFGCCVTVYTHRSFVLVDENLDQNLDSTEIKGNFASLEPRFQLKLELPRNRL